jgi:hypothetical protein
MEGEEGEAADLGMVFSKTKFCMYFKLFYSITYIVSYFSLLLDVSVVLGRFIQECTASYPGISGILCGEMVFIVYKFDLYISFQECINYTHQELTCT